MTSPEHETFQQALAEGRLLYQRCAACDHTWLPPRAECPRCWQASPAWQQASGDAELISWVVYHRAYDPALADRLPYNVALVRLAEGPQMVTNLVGAFEWSELGDGTRLQLAIEQADGVPLARFAVVAPAD